MKKLSHLFARKRVLFLCLACLSFFFSNAQKVSPPTPEAQWHVQEVREPGGNYDTPESFAKSIVYLNETEAVFPIQYNKDEWGVAKVDQQGKQLWQTKIKEVVIGVAKRDDNILSFYKAGEDFINEIHVQVISAANGKVLQDKVIFNNGTKIYIEPKILTRQDGTFIGLLVRVSNYPLKNYYDSEKERKERLSTSKLSLLELGSDLSVASTEIKTTAKEGLFMGCQVGKNDDLFYSSILGEQLQVERFQKTGALVSKLTTPFSRRSGILVPVTSLDINDLETVFIGLHYENKDKDRANQLFGFDFAAKKVLSAGEETPNKAMKKSLELTEIKDLQSADFYYIERLRIIDIVSTKDKVVVVKEMPFVNYPERASGATRYRNDVLIISIYDRQLKFIKIITLDKKYEAFVEVGRSIGIKVKDDKLYAVMGAVQGVASYATLLAVINLNNQQLELFTKLDKELRKAQSIEGGATLWFSHSFLLEYLDEEGGMFSKKNYHAIWQKVEY
jgi:hypothetical protein